MTDEFSTTAKQTALELIALSEQHAADMQTWGDLLEQNPESVTATLSAGFINKVPSTAMEMVIDVQTPPDEPPILRTWAINTTADDSGQEYFDNIQLTFAVDPAQARELVAKGRAITRSDIRALLQDAGTHLTDVTVSNKSGGDGKGQTHGERYDFAATELQQQPEDAAKVTQALHTVLQSLQQA